MAITKTATNNTMPVRCYIALGSNLKNPMQQVSDAVNEINALTDCQVIAQSTWYQSKAVGPEQPDYINGVIAIDCELSPIELLDALQAIEKQHQRVREIHWGPRTLDLDILLYGNEQISSPRLTIPHPFLCERIFVLLPLHDIAPDLQLPDGSFLQSHLASCDKQGILRLD